MSFTPYSKEDQLKAYSKPKLKKKRYPEKKKAVNPLKQEIFKGRRFPKWSVRGKISKSNYNKALNEHGNYCFVCGTVDSLEAHHVRFRSDGGRGGWRNIRFLCTEHHRGDYSPHKNRELRETLEEAHTALYGKWYWADKYDLFKEGLIPNTTDKAFEEFMEKEAADRG